MDKSFEKKVISENISEVCVKTEPALGFPIGILLRENGAEWRTMQLQIYATDTRMQLNIYLLILKL